MTYTDKHIMETYSGLLEGLSSEGKTELIESLSKSLNPEKKNKESNFYKSFGAFASEKSAEEIITATSILCGLKCQQCELKCTIGNIYSKRTNNGFFYLPSFLYLIR